MINYNIHFNKVSATAIVFWGRSGSVFLGSLLDNHETILTIPDVLETFYDKNGFWNSYNHIKDLNKLLEAFCETYSCLFSKDFKYGFIDQIEFTNHMLGFSKHNSLLDRKSFFIAIHYAYALCLKQDITKKRIINYQLHDSSQFTRLDSFLQDFQTPKFLATYRNPIRALHSHMRLHKTTINNCLETNNKNDIYSLYTWKKVDNKDIEKILPKEQYEYIDEVIDGQYLRYYIHQLVGWKKALFQFKLDVKPIQLEKLHDSPITTMKSVASYLDIEYKDTLIKSTFNNKLFYSGSLNGIQNINGFSSSHTRLSEYQESFNEHDVYVLNNIVSRVHQEYLYLRDDNLSLNKLLDMIKIPTKIEFLAIENTYGTFKYDLVMDSYYKRVELSTKLLTSSFSEFALEGFYR